MAHRRQNAQVLAIPPEEPPAYFPSSLSRSDGDAAPEIPIESKTAPRNTVTSLLSQSPTTQPVPIDVKSVLPVILFPS